MIDCEMREKCDNSVMSSAGLEAGICNKRIVELQVFTIANKAQYFFQLRKYFLN